MSTHIRPATEPNPTTETRNDPEPTATTPPTTAPSADDDADAESWVARCQSQFDAGRTGRLRNFADAENHAMPGGV